MLKKAISLLLIISAVYWSFNALMPNKISSLETNKNQFSTERALKHLAAISKKPHFVGTNEHTNVRNYIVKQLNDLGLETEIQEGYTISRWGNITKAKNILARIKGREQGKALMVLSHYDSNPHSSPGASDAGSGVVTILEGIRAFLSEEKTPKNDIIILISDAEELGLNGADLFVNNHAWAKDIGLVLNFEARGSGGPSYMLIETNAGNANLVKAFVDANPKFPVGNSLAYSIYKMLPNDTDLTVFRRDGDINGFNFAFIDDHFDYHSAMDNYDRLDKNSLEHQGAYLMPLLHYFSEANLNNLKSTEDYIYFNIPIFNTVIYPYNWILPMLIISILFFSGLIIYGKRQRVLQLKEIGKGFLAFIVTIFISGLAAYFGWKLIQILYPVYGDILHGFTYNGHAYIWTFAWLTLGICFYVYHKIFKVKNRSSLLIAPLFFWILICGIVALKLKGASFFIIPVFFALLILYLMIKYGKGKEVRLSLITILCFPLLFIMSPFIKMFPVGLGLKALFISTIFIVMVFGLLIPVFGTFKHKNRWSYLFFFFALIFFVAAHFNSDFKMAKPKPNSLVYVLDQDTNTAIWATYDHVLDKWTKNFLGDDPDKAESKNTFGSKYGTGYNYTKNAPVKTIAQPEIVIYNDTIIGEDRHFKISVRPQRKVNRLEIFSEDSNKFRSFTINGIDAYRIPNDEFVFNNRWNNRLFSYYVSDDEPLDMFISVPKDQKTTLQLYEASYDLLENEQFTIPERARNMMPKPFVLNDAIMIKKTITIE
jgi:hypothetical protein